MEFLFPLVGLSLLAVAIPLYVHLHRRFRGPVIQFSALRFLEDEPLARRAPLRLRNPLLFAVRAAAIALLTAAFAWPYWPHERVPTQVESQVYVLDNTLSHQAENQFEAARERLAEAIGRADAGTLVAVVELAAQPRVLVPFGQDRIAAFEAVRAIEPSFERGSLAAALRLADTLLRQSPAQRRRLVLLSDCQANQIEELVEAPPFLEADAIELPSFERESRPNLALARPQLRRLLAGDRTFLELLLDIYHSGEAEQATVAVEANGEPVFRRTVDLVGQPERVQVSIRWEAARGVSVRGHGSIEGSGDSLPADNRVFFSLPPVRRGQVALAAGSLFLRAAFAPDVMQEAWEAQVLDPRDAVSRSRAEKPADVLCVEATALQGSSAAKVLLSNYIDAGSGVLIILNEATPPAVAALEELGFHVDPQPVTAAQPVRAGYLQREHAIFRPFRSSDFGNLTQVEFSRYYRVSSSAAVPLLFTDSGDPILFELTDRGRRILLAGFGLDRESTNWPAHPTFIPFLDLCLQWLRDDAAVPANFAPGEIAVWHLPPGSLAREYVVRGEDRELGRGMVEAGRVQFPVPSRPGVYSVQFDSDESAPVWVAVNPPPEESVLEYMEPSAVIRQPPRDKDPIAESPPVEAVLSRREILQQRLWWVALLGGLALLLGETVWLAARKEL